MREKNSFKFEMRVIILVLQQFLYIFSLRRIQ